MLKRFLAWIGSLMRRRHLIATRTVITPPPPPDPTDTPFILLCS
jgi:hypothetical protein